MRNQILVLTDSLLATEHRTTLQYGATPQYASMMSYFKDDGFGGNPIVVKSNPTIDTWDWYACKETKDTATVSLYHLSKYKEETNKTVEVVEYMGTTTIDGRAIDFLSDMGLIVKILTQGVLLSRTKK